MNLGFALAFPPYTIDAAKIDPDAVAADVKNMLKAGLSPSLDELDAQRLKLFAAKEGDGWMAKTSREMRALHNRDASQVESLVKQEIDPHKPMKELFPLCRPIHTVQLLVVAPPVIACMLVGYAGVPVRVELDYNATVSQLKVLLRGQEPRLQGQDSFKLFLAKSNGCWLSQGSDDVLTLELGDVTPSVKSLLQACEIDSSKTVEQVFGIDPNRDSIHALVVVPGVRPRDALPEMLRLKRVHAHWDSLIRELKPTLDDCVTLKRIRWSNVDSLYTVEKYQEEARSVPDACFERVKAKLEEASKAVPELTTSAEMDCVLFALFVGIISTVDTGMTIYGKHHIENPDGRLRMGGDFDFLFASKTHSVCLMGARRAYQSAFGHDSDDDSEEGVDQTRRSDADSTEEEKHEEAFSIENGGSEERSSSSSESERSLALSDHSSNSSESSCEQEEEMETGLAQTVMAMELLHACGEDRVVNGIVTNYGSWTFVRLEYRVGDRQPRVLIDEDYLMRLTYTPTDEDLKRIIGKILSVFLVTQRGELV